MRISILILAAGSSSRMGRSKQLLDVGGKSLIQRTAEISINSKANDVTVVLGSTADQHADALRGIKISVVVNSDWANGMGSSIKSGVKSLIATSSPDAIIVLVCDQPFLTSTHLNKLIETYQTSQKSIVASAYSGSFGVPVLIDKKHFGALLAIDDAHGAKQIVRQHISDVELIDFPEGATDLDTPEDYSAFLSQS